MEKSMRLTNDTLHPDVKHDASLPLRMLNPTIDPSIYEPHTTLTKLVVSALLGANV